MKEIIISDREESRCDGYISVIGLGYAVLNIDGVETENVQASSIIITINTDNCNDTTTIMYIFCQWLGITYDRYVFVNK